MCIAWPTLRMRHSQAPPLHPCPPTVCQRAPVLQCVKHNRGQGCTECNQQGQCIKCVGPESFLHNGACAPCNALTDRCARCTKTGACKACEDGWALQAGKCVPCTDPLCSACSSPGRCTLCKTVLDESVRNSPTLYIDSKGRCQQVRLWLWPRPSVHRSCKVIKDLIHKTQGSSQLNATAGLVPPLLLKLLHAVLAAILISERQGVR